jgi:hypothetical protein
LTVEAPVISPLAGHDLDAARARDLHLQLLARDLLDAHGHRPGRLLELELAELGVVGARARRLALQLDEELPRLVSRRHERQRAEISAARRRRFRRTIAPSRPQRFREAGRQRMVGALGDAQHGAPRARVRRNLALRRLDRATDEASGAGGSAAVRIGRRSSRGSPPNGLEAEAKKRFTIRSSSEWKLMTARRPRVASIEDERGQRQRELLELAIDENLRAWNVRVAGS